MAKGNKYNFIGVVKGGGIFDAQVFDYMKVLIYDAARLIRERDGFVTRQALSRYLEVERNRVVRICKLLGINDIFPVR